MYVSNKNRNFFNSEVNKRLAKMHNEKKGIDVGTATEDCSDFDDSSDAEQYNVFNEGISVPPRGTRTLDNRLNPHAPDFVPGLSARLLVEKIVIECKSITNRKRNEI